MNVEVLEKKNSQPEWLTYGDWIRIIGTFAVVLTHCIDFKLYNQQIYDYHRTEWWVANIIDAATRWAVPVYIMLSGAILLDPKKAEPSMTFYKKRLARVGLPLLVWVPFFVWFSLYVTHWQTKEQVLHQILYGEPYGHLHFVVRIIGLYAFTPMLRIFIAHTTRNMLFWTIVLMLSFGALNSCIDAFTEGRNSAAIRFVPFIGYYFAGFYLRDVHLTYKGKIQCYLAAFLSTLIIVVYTGWLVPSYGLKWYPSVSFMLYDFLSVPRIVLGITVWLLLIDWCRNLPNPKWITFLAAATLGIYIIHPVFKDLAVVLKFWTPERPLWPFFFIYYFAVYVCSAITVMIFLKIPLLRKIVG